MLVSDLSHLPRQVALTPAMQKALDFLKTAPNQDLQPGRVEIDGKNVYAMVQVYETLPAEDEVKFEAHRQYIDVQYIVSGEEGMGWAPLADLPDPTPYDAEKDACFGRLKAGQMTLARVQAGQAAVFYPEDAHAPKLAWQAPCAVRKIVVKVAVNGE